MRVKPLVLTLGCVSVLIALSAGSANAQGRRGHVVSRPPVMFVGGYDYPAFGFDQWYPYPPFPYPVMGYPPGPGLYRAENPASIRLQVTPREALVYVDGYSAGIVDDFDGVFQRLQLFPGHHEIVVYLQGYRTLRQDLYLNPGSSHAIRHTMVPIGPGDAMEPPPVPLVPPMLGVPPGPMVQPPPQASRFGTLALRVQPADANILVDGESWRGPQSQDRLVVQLAEGRHRVQVEKAGFDTFSVEIEVPVGETTSLNISLLAAR